MADGSIIIDTSIQTDGFKEGGKEIEAAARRMAKSVHGVSDAAKIALQKQLNAFVKQNQLYAQQERKVKDLEKQLEEMADKKVATDEFSEIGKQIDIDTVKVNKLIKAQEEFMKTGGKENSSAYKRRQIQIEELKNSIKYAKGEQDELLSSDRAYRPVDTTAAEQKLIVEKQRLLQMNNSLNASYDALTNKVVQYGGKVSTLTGIKQRLNKAVSSLRDRLKKAASSMLHLNKSTNKSHMTMGKMLVRSLMFSIVFRALNAIINGAKEGMNNLAQYSDETNKDLSALKSSLTQLKNSFATAFAPILSVVTPILTGFMNTISKTVSYVGMLMAALTGKGTFTKAVEVQEDYAAGLDSTADSAKNAEKAQKGYLSGLDEVNRFSNNDSSSTKAGTVNPSEMFEEVTITDSVSNLADIFKQKFAEGDWKGIGIIISESLSNAISGIDFLALGTKISDAIKYALDFAIGLVSGFDWQMLGNKIADFINGIDWPGILGKQANLVSEVLLAALDLLIGFVEQLDWAKLGSDLWNSLVSIITNIDWSGLISKAYRLLGAALGGATALIVGLVKEIWESLKTAFENTKAYFMTYIDEAGGDVVAGLLNGIWEGIKNVGQWIVDHIFTPIIDGFKNAFGIHSPSTVMEEMGTYLMDGLFNGISSLVEKVVGVFTDIKSKISEKWEEIKLSTSTKWNDIKSKLTTTWENLKDKSKTLGEKIKENVSNAWGKVKTKTSEVWDKVKSSVGDTWDNMKDNASEFGKDVKTAFSNSWDTVKSNANDVWDSIKSELSSTWNAMTSNSKKSGNNMKNNMYTSFSEMAAIATNKWKNMGSTTSQWASWIYSTTKNQFNALKNTISDIYTRLASNSHSKWSGIGKNIYQWASWIYSNTYNVFSKMKSAITAIFDGMGTAIRNKINTIIYVLNRMISGVTSGINSMISSLNGIRFSIPSWVPLLGGNAFGLNIGYVSTPHIPYLATGAVIPPNAPFMAMLGDQKHGRNLEMPEDLLRKIVREETGGNQTGSKILHNRIQLNRRTLLDEMIEEAKLVQMQSGRNPFEFA